MTHRLARVPGTAKFVAALAVALLLAACDFSALMPKEHVDFAKTVVSLVQNRDAEGLEAVSEPSLWQRLTPELRARMARTFPAEAPVSVDVASYRSSFNNGATDVTIILLYRYPQTVVQAAVSFRTMEHGYELTAIHVSPAGGDGATPSTNTQRDM